MLNYSKMPMERLYTLKEAKQPLGIEFLINFFPKHILDRGYLRLLFPKKAEKTILSGSEKEKIKWKVYIHPTLPKTNHLIQSNNRKTK